MIHFKLNEPQIFKLADVVGDTSGPLTFYPTLDCRLLVLPLEASRKLAVLGVQPGEEISITCVGQGSWVICLTPRSEQARADAEIAAEGIKPAQCNCPKCARYADADAIAAEERRVRQLAKETRENLGRQLEGSLAVIRQMHERLAADPSESKSTHPAAGAVPQERAESGQGLDAGPYVPVATPTPQNGKKLPRSLSKCTGAQPPVSYRDALQEITDTVLEMLVGQGEQWGDQAKQDLISTLFIAGAKAGGILFDFGGDKEG